VASTVHVAALRGGHFRVSEWARANGCPWAEDAILGAIEGGHLDCLLQMGVGVPVASTAFHAARFGHLHIIQWLCERGVKHIGDRVFGEAIRRGHMHIAHWMLDNQRSLCVRSPNALAHAAKRGSVALLEMLFEAGCRCGRGSYRRAAKRGYIHVFEWLYAHGFRPHGDGDDDGRGATAAQVAALHGHLAALRWLRKHGFGCCQTTYAAAANGGHVDVPEWLYRKEPLSMDSTMRALAAATVGHIDALCWANDRGCTLSKEISLSAVRFGDVRVVCWLAERGCSWDDDLYLCAARAGHAHLLQWAHDLGYGPPDGIDCAHRAYDRRGSAADAGLAVIMAMRAHGVRVDAQKVLPGAITKGALDTIEWCHAMGCRLGDDVCAPAARRGQWEVLQLLHRLGCSWGDHTMDAAVRHANVALVAWLVNRGCPWTERACEIAAPRSGRMFQWLRDHGCPFDMDRCMMAIITWRDDSNVL